VIGESAHGKMHRGTWETHCSPVIEPEGDRE
jgi:hypothetical protein